MARRRRHRLVALCLLALAAALPASGCGKTHKAGEAVREGLSTPLDGLHYTVFLTRELNIRNQEDSGYVPGAKDPAPGRGWYGVFLQACNTGKSTATASSNFTIVDTQGDEFHPTIMKADNPFAYHGGPVPPQNCEPARGSLAQQGPTSGAMLLFDLPLAATENRPLELHIQGNAQQEAAVVLDI
ncbi:MAG: hypothetical protein ACJ76Z_02135 [Thermoleophilaceae bacterium]